jgi:hypothetical protein
MTEERQTPAVSTDVREFAWFESVLASSRERIDNASTVDRPEWYDRYATTSSATATDR